MLDEDGRPPLSAAVIRRIVIIGVVFVAAMTALVLATGPKIGWLTPKNDVQQYGELALRRMEETGYFARGPQWQQAKDTAQRELAGARDLEAALAILAPAAVVAGGPGSAIVKENVTALAAHTPADVTRTEKITTIKLSDRTQLSPQEDLFYLEDLQLKVEKEASATCGWTIDARGASGGGLLATLAGFHRFLPQGVVVEAVNRDGKRNAINLINGQIEVHSSVQGRGLAGKELFGPVVVVVDEHTAGAAEALVLALGRRTDTHTVGAKTRGHTGLTAPSLLPHSTLLKVTGSFLAAPGQAPATDGVHPSAGGGLSEAQDWLRQRCR